MSIGQDEREHWQPQSLHVAAVSVRNEVRMQMTIDLVVDKMTAVGTMMAADTVVVAVDTDCVQHFADGHFDTFELQPQIQTCK